MRRKLFVICILLVTSIRADIINGDTDPIGVPRDLSINPIDVGILVDEALTTSIKNHILTHVSGMDRLRTFTATSKLFLQNTTLSLDGTFTFSHGSIDVIGKVVINGSGNKFRLAAASLFIAEGSELRIGPGVEFEFAPTSSWRKALYFADSTSKLVLEDATLTVNNDLGMNLIRGNLCIEGNSVIDNAYTDTNKALFLGVGYETLGDCNLKIASGATLTVKKAGVVWRNKGQGSFDGSEGEGTLVIDSTGNFLLEKTVVTGSDISSFDFSKLSGKSMIGDISGVALSGTGIETGASVRSSHFSPNNQFVAALFSSTLNVYSFDSTSATPLGASPVATIALGQTSQEARWSPDGQFIVVALNSGGGTEIRVYRFDPSGVLVEIGSGIETGQSVRQATFSPDGRFVLVGFLGGGGTEVRVYRFDPSSTIPLKGIGATLGFGLDSVAVNWFPNGRFIVVGDGSGSLGLNVYRFDPIVGIISTAVATAVPDDRPFDVEVSPCGRYIAVGTDSTGDFQIFKFDLSASTPLALVASEAVGRRIDGTTWSATGPFIAIALVGGSGDEIRTYHFDPDATDPLLFKAGINLTGTSNLPGLHWSLDDRFLVNAGSYTFIEDINIYEVSRDSFDSKFGISGVTVKLKRDLELNNVNLKAA